MSENRLEHGPFENAITGNQIHFLELPAGDNETLLYELTIAPGFTGRLFELELRHPDQILSIVILEGALEEQIPLSKTDGTSQIAPKPARIGEGEKTTIDASTGRRFKNGLTDSETRVHVEVTPPFDMYQFITHGYEIAQRRNTQTTEDVSVIKATPTADISELSASTEVIENEVENPAQDPITYPTLSGAASYVWNGINWKVILFGGIACAVSIILFVVLVYLLYLNGTVTTVEGIVIWALTILSLSPVLGYLVRVSRNVIYGYSSFPSFSDWSGLLTDGLKIGVVFLMFLTIPMYALFALLGPFSVLALPLAFQYEVVQNLFAIVASFIAYYVFPAAYLQYVETEQLRSVLDRRSIQSALWNKAYFISHVRFLLVYALVAIVFVIAILFPIFDLATTLVSPFIIFYALVVSSVYFAIMWKAVSAEQLTKPASQSRLTLLLHSLLGNKNTRSSAAKENPDLNTSSEQEAKFRSR